MYLHFWCAILARRNIYIYIAFIDCNCPSPGANKESGSSTYLFLRLHCGISRRRQNQNDSHTHTWMNNVYTWFSNDHCEIRCHLNVVSKNFQKIDINLFHWFQFQFQFRFTSKQINFSLWIFKKPFYNVLCIINWKIGCYFWMYFNLRYQSVLSKLNCNFCNHKKLWLKPIQFFCFVFIQIYK